MLTDGGNQLLPAPVLFTVTETSVPGIACPGCTVEIYSDAEDEGRVYEGSIIADAASAFTPANRPDRPVRHRHGHRPRRQYVRVLGAPEGVEADLPADNPEKTMRRRMPCGPIQGNGQAHRGKGRPTCA